MIAFVVPFRPKETSQNWAYHSALLGRTLKSICNQSANSFMVIVVYTDLPENQFHHPRIVYLKFPYQRLGMNDITDYPGEVSKIYNERDAVNVMDQGRRTIFGAKEAIRLNCNYIMSVDADDLISDKIASFVEKNSSNKSAGWYVNKGFVFFEGEKHLMKQPFKMNELNGSTHIIRCDLIPIPDFNSHNLLDFHFFSAHGWLRKRISQQYGEELTSLPFYAVIYSINPGGWTFEDHKLSPSGIRQIFKTILLFRFLSVKISREFGYYPVKT
jgi:hypothetical protein